ncbi:Cupredoxin [Massariosphaeria phaeospora]|uniref:Cupredoxin n=1 Tax=Massariosphaeria phaeospora TaxID=100035 RepID=A0A7C8MGN3_9PLEO|nr:Cupredoxin [Massariosphaeria phaeospora]
MAIGGAFRDSLRCRAFRPHSTGVTHRIFAGATTENGGLHYEPQNVVAEPGDVIEFHFLPKNHTVTQSSFDAPCEPLEHGVFSGFNFRTDAGEAPNVFTFTVLNKEPFWYYCSQTNGDHCQKGMAGVINQNFDGEKTLAAYKEKAKTAVTKQPSANPVESKGGDVVASKPL